MKAAFPWTLFFYFRMPVLPPPILNSEFSISRKSPFPGMLVFFINAPPNGLFCCGWRRVFGRAVLIRIFSDPQVTFFET